MSETECGLPMGQNFIIAVVPYGGCNQNDSIVLSRQSVERGLGMSLSYHTTRFDVHTPYRLYSTHPDIPGGLGIVLPGHAVRPGSAMLAAHVPPAAGSMDSTPVTVEAPIVRTAKADDTGLVHRVVVTCGSEGYVMATHGCYNLHSWSAVRQEHIRIGRGTDPITVRITVVALREPRVGDKFASRHGQKGTVGQLIDQADLPYTIDGTVPDILFNAHGIPSRMTMGQMWEQILSKLNALVGREGGRFGVPFTGMDKLATAITGLHAAGFPGMGRRLRDT